MSTVVKGKKSSTITFPAGEGSAKGYIALPESKGPGVMVLHAWWGLNDFFKGFCDRLAEQGFVAFAPDLNKGIVVSTVDEAKELAEKRSDGANLALASSALDFFQQQPYLARSRIGVVGFSMGAAYAMLLAEQKPDTVAAVVTFYGAWVEDPSKARAAFLGHFAKEDEWEPLSGILKIEGLLKQSGKNVTFHVYPEAKHWFVEENRPNDYEPNSASLAWKRTLDFLQTHLSQA